jgi:hypothetical protein
MQNRICQRVCSIVSRIFAVLVVLGVYGKSACGDEGMFPVSEIGRLNLQARGLELDPKEIFNAEKPCLIDAICRVNGCTGSFISSQGLIITNHHCAYGAIQKLSTRENDYLANGFLASSRAEELSAPGYTVRITESFEDVSEKVLSVVEPGMSFLERTKAIQKQQRTLEQAAEEQNPGRRAEVAEMFVGERYVLFLYVNIKDVRLVFAPPSSIGNFGGEIDNWEWPRHTGDFSFLRAYVAPDGSPADYSPDNVPFQPKRFLPVNPRGTQENDFVMLLGYPGRTARHNTASFLKFEQDIRLPYLVETYQREIARLEQAGAEDRAIALKLASRIKSMANVEKRSRGQLRGLQQLRFVERRAAEETELQAFINADPQRREKFGDLFAEINAVYAEMTDHAELEFGLRQLGTGSPILGLANFIVDAAHERQKPSLERERGFGDNVFAQTRERFELQQRDFHPPSDRSALEATLIQLSKVEASKVPVALAKVVKSSESIQQFLDHLYQSNEILATSILNKTLEMTPEELTNVDEPFIQFAIALYPTLLELRERDKDREGRLSRYYGDLFNVKREFAAADSSRVLVPDANATLRLTVGRVEGYSPADAIYKAPFTTVAGLLAKNTGLDPFDAPPQIAQLHAARDFGNYLKANLNDVPVAMLYSTDSTGGNSGSPVINARGELVGVNFDRTFDATINDFAWDHAYSRSIGVDIRYVLWITGKVYGATALIEELGFERP